ncbi:MAG: NADH:flavin oxidoreductase [Planctomycetaceae bacterium]|nr:NADH:flavin oxidoreductase [Planctomycetaceae bacterium]
MAHYFRYKTAADVVADAERLGLSHIAMSDDLSVMFQPIEVGGRTVGNRWAIQPMEGCDGTLDGLPDELTFRRYVRFGSGGAKLIWGEATAIAADARMNPRQLWLHDGSAAAIEKMLTDCRTAHRESCGHDGDLLLGLQLTHSGRFSFRRPLLATHDPILDPLTKDKSTGQFVDASFPLLTDDDLKRIEDQYVVAARLTARIGCDFIDIKQCHRYLLSELLAAKNRPGNYGGSLENRTRLVRNVITRIRAELPSLLIASRFNAYDGIPYRGAGEEFIGEPCPHELPLTTAFGTNPHDHLRDDLAEPLQLARWLREWGVCLLNVSLGNPYANPHLVRPAEYPPVDGYKPPEHPLIGVDRHFRIAACVQNEVPDIPVIGSGYSWLQDFVAQAAAANVSLGRAAFAGLGRGTLSQPDFVKELADTGRLDRKRVCRTFSYCTNLMRTKDHPLGQYATGCPPFDKEVYGPLWKEAEAKRVNPK